MIASNTFSSNQDPNLPTFVKSYSYDPRSFEQPQNQGIRVTTSLRTNPMTSRSTSSDFSAIDPSFLAKRYQKSSTNVGSLSSRSQPETIVGSGVSTGKMLFDRLAKTNKVRVVRMIEEVEGASKGRKIVNMRYRLEDVDENLDMLTIDDDSFHFAKIGVEIYPESSEFRIFLKNSQEAIDSSEGFEMKGLSLLREKMWDIVYINGRGEKCLIGKSEFLRKKMRMYNLKKQQLYKICRSSGLNSKIRDLHVKDAKREKVSFGTLTHLNELTAECEMEFPKLCKPEERLMMIAMLLAFMERTERYLEGKYNPIMMLKRAVSNIK